MTGGLEQLEAALPAAEASALRAAAPADFAAALRFLADGPEDSFRAALGALPPDVLRDTAAAFLSSDTPGVGLRMLDGPALRPFLPELLARAPKDRKADVLPKLAVLEKPAELAAAAAALAPIKPGPAFQLLLRCLTWTGEPSLFPLFERLLASRRAEDRQTGIEGIARGAGKGEVDLLRRAIQAELEAQRGRTAKKLVDYTDYDFLELALDRLHEIGARPDAAFFRAFFELPANGPGKAAVEVLARHGRRDLLPLLEEALRHKGEGLRLAAVRAVARLGDAAARARLIERFLSLKSAYMGEVYPDTLADAGVVDAIPFLERFRREKPRRWTLYGDAVARLELLRFRHKRASRDHVRGRLAALEAEFDPQPRKDDYGPERPRGALLLSIYAALGDEASFDDLRGRLQGIYGVPVFQLAERAPHPCFIAALREQPMQSDPVRLLQVRIRCGDEDARDSLRAYLERERIFGFNLENVRFFPASERASLWRALFERLSGEYRLIALEWLPKSAPTEAFRPLLREIAARGDLAASVRARAAWWAEQPYPEETALPPIAELRREDIDALRRKAAKAPAKV